jgi:hydrogenase maturation protein HypF
MTEAKTGRTGGKLLADALVAWVQAAASQSAYASTQVCLGGGCFVNRVLRERVTQGLQAAGFQVHRPATQSGDAQLCLGQAWVVSKQLRCTGVLSHEKEKLTCV